MSKPPYASKSSGRRKHDRIIFVILIALLILAGGCFLLKTRNYTPSRLSGSQITSPSKAIIALAIISPTRALAQETMPLDTISPCYARDITATVFWHGALGTELGSIIYTNTSEKACLLFGYPTIHLKDSKGDFYDVKIQQNDIYGFGITDEKLAILHPGQDSIGSDFAWQGCATKPEGTIDVYSTLPHNIAPLLVHNNETPMRITPFCPDNPTPSVTSYLIITPFERLKS